MANSFSHFGGPALAAHRALASYGVDANQVFEATGISTEGLNDPHSRFKDDQWKNFWRTCVEMSGDPGFNIKCVEFINPTQFHAFGGALFASKSIRTYATRFCRHFHFFSSDKKVLFETDGDLPELTVEMSEDVKPDATDHFIIEGVFIFFTKMLRIMSNEEFAPTRLHVTNPDGTNLEAYEAFFRCPVTFGSDRDFIELDPTGLDDQLPSANAELARLNDEIVIRALADIDKSDLPNRVRREVIVTLPTGDCNKVTIARNLGMSIRSFHNKLLEAETSFQEIYDEIRLKLAIQYLRQGTLPASEIAYLLGFSELSNFSRAFKRWTGKPPSEYLEAQKNKDRAG